MIVIEREMIDLVISQSRASVEGSDRVPIQMTVVFLADEVDRLKAEVDRLKAVMPAPSPDFAITRNISEGARRALKAGGYHGD